ncbi:metal ABC transporter permease [Acerihabitans sp.]|uniref:metal ABC transporter permease n=1 Tax=Acerihabitans sp. TaxID=2811394 RepID=UPI002ED7FFB9
MIFHLLFDPFTSLGFMRRALVACLALSLSSTPLGVFLSLRRMSLVGDALSHAILPGVAIGYLLSGMSLMAMGIGGFIAGLLVAVLSGWVTSLTVLKEDASFAGFYLGSLALGVTLVSLRGSSVDLLHLLFGTVLAVDSQSILFVGLIATFTLLCLALVYRALVIEAFDAAFLRINLGGYPRLIHALFLALVVLNLVAGFQILGTLMSVGLMMLPAVAARCWSGRLPATLLIALFIGLLSAWAGLLWSFYASIPAGPAIVLTASLIFFISVLLGPRGSFTMMWRRRHFAIGKAGK